MHGYPKCNVYMKKQLILIIVSLLSLTTILALSVNIPSKPINYTEIILNYTSNHSLTCDNATCWSTPEGVKCAVSDITYDEISGGDVNANGYTGYFAYLVGTVGGIDMNGDPWYWSGASQEFSGDVYVDNNFEVYGTSNLKGNLTVNGYSYLNNTYPLATLTYDLGSGASRWRYLYVQNISFENADGYNLHLTENLTIDGMINGVNISTLALNSNLSNYVPYTGATGNVDLNNKNISNLDWINKAGYTHIGQIITNNLLWGRGIYAFTNDVASNELRFGVDDLAGIEGWIYFTGTGNDTVYETFTGDFSPSNNEYGDMLIDLGKSNSRFRDLWLSRTVNLNNKIILNGTSGNGNFTGNVTAQYYNGINISTLALNSNIINYTSDEIWINKNSSNAFNFNSSKLSTIYYNATQSVAIAGTIDGGTLADTNHQDGKYDGVTFNFSEVSATPGLDLRINFTNITSFNQGVMRYKTASGLSGAYPIIQMWNYDTSIWEDYPAVAQSLTFATITQPVFDSAEHVSNGVAQMRIYKATKGNTGNKYYVDWIAISKGFGTPSGEEVDPYSFHMNQNLNNSGYNISADYFIGDGSLLTGITGDNSSWNATALNGYAQYNFTTNNFNGSGNFNTTGIGRFSNITDTGLTSGRVVYVTTSGQLTDSSVLTFNGTTLALSSSNAIQFRDSALYIYSDGDGQLRLQSDQWISARSQSLGSEDTGGFAVYGQTQLNSPDATVDRQDAPDVFYVNKAGTGGSSGSGPPGVFTGGAGADFKILAGNGGLALPTETGGRGGIIYLTSGNGGIGPGTNGAGGDIEITTGSGLTYGNIILVKNGGYVIIGRNSSFSGGNGSSRLQVQGDVSINGTLFTFSPSIENYNRDFLNKLPASSSIIGSDGKLNSIYMLDKEFITDIWDEYPYMIYECRIENKTEICQDWIDYNRPIQYILNKTDIFQVVMNNRILIDELKEKVILLEDENKRIKDCLLNSKDFDEYKLCVNK